MTDSGCANWCRAKFPDGTPCAMCHEPCIGGGWHPWANGPCCCDDCFLACPIKPACVEE
jgi:hypothetical protein